nr:amino acid racemase [Dechloromonas sp.]
MGIIGGLGPQATIDYYQRIVDHFQTRNHSLAIPEIVIFSLDITRLFAMIEASEWDSLANWLADKVRALHLAGAEFAAISANTPHIVFDRVQAMSPIPLVSIVDATLAAAQVNGYKRLGLLGTAFTMQSNFFARDGVSIFVPNTEEQQRIHERLISEIEHGVFTAATKQELLAIICSLQERHQLDAVILGCTELPLLLHDGDTNIPLLNTTAIHVDAICQRCIGN